MKNSVITTLITLALGVATLILISLQFGEHAGLKISAGLSSRQYTYSGTYVCGGPGPNIPSRGWPIEYHYPSYKGLTVDCPDILVNTNVFAAVADGLIVVVLAGATIYIFRRK